MANKSRRSGPTRKHLARAERERRVRQYILIGTGIVVAAALGLVIYGIVNARVIQPRQPIADVNGSDISTDDFQKLVRYQRSQLVQQYSNTVLGLQQFGSDPSIVSYISNTLSQISVQLDNPEYLGQNVLDQTIEDHLIKQEAERLGITVSQEEIDRSLEEAFGFYPDGRPTSTATLIPKPTSTLSALQKSLVTSTPPAENSPTPTLPPTATPTDNPENTPTPTATPYTREAFETNLQDTVASFADIGMTEADLRNLVASQLLRDKVLDVITVDTPHTEEQVWARHILVDDEATAREVLDRLNSGEDWADLASEYSTDDSNKDRGGDLGWFSRGDMVTEFEDAAFNLEIGEVSQPVQSQFGWHIIQVLGHEKRELSASAYEQNRQTAFSDWLSSLRNSATINIITGWETRVPTDPVVPADILLTAQQIIGSAQAQSTAVATLATEAAGAPAETTPAP
jgi:peptidyl-prolyl cis-trans isomerase D